MHIVIDCRFVHHSGIGRYIREIVSRLVKVASCQYTLFISQDEYDEKFVLDCSQDNVSFCYINASMYSFKEQMEIPWKIPYCDVFWSPHYNAPLLPIKAKYKIVTIHDMGHLAIEEGMSVIKKVYARLFLYNATHFYSKVLTVSKFSQNEIMRYSNISQNKIKVVYNAVNTEIYHPLKDDNRRGNVLGKYDIPSQYFIFVGNIKPNKNFVRLLKAYKVFHGMGKNVVELVVVGRRKGLLTGITGLGEMIDELKIRQCIHFTGVVSDEDLPILYSNAKGLIFPSLYEGFGIPPLEAMACGCPVIVSRCASMPEICSNAVLYVDPYDEHDIANKMNLLSLRPDLSKKMTQLGLQRVKQFSWDKAAMEILDVIQSLS